MSRCFFAQGRNRLFMAGAGGNDKEEKIRQPSHPPADRQSLEPHSFFLPKPKKVVGIFKKGSYIEHCEATSVASVERLTSVTL
jgi:hypothetical protein